MRFDLRQGFRRKGRKEPVVFIRPLDDGLAMHQLHFQAEVRTMKELGIEPAAVSEAEMTLANQLVQHLSVKRFDPNEFVDEFSSVTRGSPPSGLNLSGHSLRGSGDADW